MVDTIRKYFLGYDINMSQAEVINIVPKELDFDSDIKRGTRLTHITNQVNAYPPGIGSGQVVAPGSSLQWNISLPSSNMIDSRFEYSQTYVLTATNAALSDLAASLTAIKNKLGFTSLPNMRSIQVANCTINGTLTFSTNVADEVVDPTLYQLSEQELISLSNYAIPDKNWAFDEKVITDPLRSQPDSFIWTRSVDNCDVSYSLTGTTLTITAKVVEKALWRPCQALNGKHPKPFYGMDRLDVRLTMANDFAVACLADNTGYGFTCAVQDPYIRLRQYEPHLGIEYPPVCHWLSPAFSRETKSDTADLAVGGSVKLTTQHTFQGRVFKLAAVYATPITARLVSEPHRLLPLSDLIVDFGNSKNNFRSMSRQDLLEVSRRNGYNGNNSQWFGGSEIGFTTGSVFYFTPSDLNTAPGEQSNVLKNYAFQLTATVHNPSDAIITGGVRLNVVLIGDTIITMEGGKYSESPVAITPEELASAKNVYMGVTFEDHHILGGSFWSKLGDIVRHPITRGIVQTARNNIPGVNNLIGDQTHWGQFIRDKGYGRPEPKKRGRKAKGAGIEHLGGQKMDQSSLLSLLQG